MSFEQSLPPFNASDTLATFVNASCLDLLLGELVPFTTRIACELESESVVPSQSELFYNQQEISKQRLESLGYRIGQALAERFSKDKPRFTEQLEVIKFLCKDLWTLLFRKQIDNLKTNHKGVYVLSDNSFYTFRRMSMKVSNETLAHAQPYLWFPCGVIRGTLASLGIDATVHAESSELPSAIFQIKTIANK